jgi:hypothetical protein
MTDHRDRGADRRARLERRSGRERRGDDKPVAVERRKGGDRRRTERRKGLDRRLAVQSGAQQMQTALGLLMKLAQSKSLSDDDRRLLDTAMLRLRFATERMDDD